MTRMTLVFLFASGILLSSASRAAAGPPPAKCSSACAKTVKLKLTAAQIKTLLKTPSKFVAVTWNAAQKAAYVAKCPQCSKVTSLQVKLDDAIDDANDFRFWATKANLSPHSVPE